MRSAIDFGISNIDAVALVDGKLRYWTRPALGAPTPELVRDVLAQGGVSLADMRQLAVTGGRHQDLPDRLGGCEVVGVGEVPAIGRGGQELNRLIGGDALVPTLVVSAGSGTAVISARGDQYAHVTGTVVGGPIGRLPASATAVNFGRLARQDVPVGRADLAAALVTLVGQVIAVTAINAARAQQLERVVVIGHLTDMPTVRNVLELVGDYYGMRLTLPANAGYGTALGALYSATPLSAQLSE